MKNIDTKTNIEKLQRENILLKEKNRELEDEIFHLKNIIAMKNDEKNDENLERKLITIYREIVDFRVSFERFIKNQKLDDLKEELDKKNKDIEWAKESIESLYDEVNYKIKNFKDIK